jgi:hypothetical protein
MSAYLDLLVRWHTVEITRRLKVTPSVMSQHPYDPAVDLGPEHGAPADPEVMATTATDGTALADPTAVSGRRTEVVVGEHGPELTSSGVVPPPRRS